ncbi:MAG: DNA translocase FtsK [Streptococcaceae bacterium]|nr:DNA translocase FtsK [Streptococcaceae bacterium]
MGFFGVLLYNLVRLLVGSTAYLALTLYLAYLILARVKKEWFENRRLISGTLISFTGLVLFWQAIFAMNESSDTAFWNILSDLGNFRVSLPAGGGFIGWLLYFPSKALFSSIGVFIIAVLFVIVGCFVAEPKLIHKLREAIYSMLESRTEAKLERQRQREEAEALAEQELREKGHYFNDFNEDFEESEVNGENAEAADYFKDVHITGEFDSIVEPKENHLNSTTGYNFDNYQYSERFRNPLGMMTDEDADWQDIYASDDNGEASGYGNKEDDNAEQASYPAYNLTEIDLEKGVERKVAASSTLERIRQINQASQNVENSEHHSLYQLPTSDLLAKVPVKSQEKEKAQVRKNIKVLEETFKSFGINASVESAVVGPSVTKYEIKLATGVRVNRVANLSDDLALALAAKDVRIEAPIPGKSLVGIEIPNLEIATVGFREMWEEAKTNPDKLLEIPLGKSLDGSIKTFDLARMPHLLVAGSTGSGKSVAVNGIIASILMKSLPSQVKFLMVDPKMVELSVYNDIPQLLIPVVTNPRKASRALQRVVDEMERRYELFSRKGVRNMEGYNQKIETFNAASDEKEIPLPFIVVIVDELADLMMVASKEVEDAIIRLGQKARAAGIHMILATQRPSVDVISGLIKANVPSRVAFAVSSGTDSRTIIDQNGAEKLLGRGDMLFKPIDENHPLRLQGAFLSDADVETLVDFIKGQAEVEYDDAFDPGEDDADDNRSGYAGNAGGDSGDPLFEQAKSLVITSQKASTAQIQRTLKVGFNRATDLMNELEAAGIVGPAKGTTPRKVLMNLSGDYSGDDNYIDNSLN